MDEAARNAVVRQLAIAGPSIYFAMQANKLVLANCLVSLVFSLLASMNCSCASADPIGTPADLTKKSPQTGISFRKA